MCNEDYKDHLIHSKGPGRKDWREPSQRRYEAVKRQAEPVAEFEGTNVAKRINDPRKPKPRENFPTHVTSAPELTRSGLPKRNPPDWRQSTGEPIEVTEEFGALSGKLQPKQVEE